jgi:redox-sensitive bicupin YhaK (pirin superfamily)
MMHLRRSGERRCVRSWGEKLWLTFYPSLREDPLASGFGDLLALSEGFVAPDGGMTTDHRRCSKTVTYVVEGLMSQLGWSERSTLIRAGDFQCTSGEYSQSSIQYNASTRERLHVLTLSLLSTGELSPNPQQKSFSSQSRAGCVRLVGSADGREGSLALGQDVSLYSGLLTAEQDLLYAVAPRRMAWLQVLQGQMSVNEATLEAGDGVGFSHVSSLSLRAATNVELVLVDLAGHAPHHGLWYGDVEAREADHWHASVSAANAGGA